MKKPYFSFTTDIALFSFFASIITISICFIFLKTTLLSSLQFLLITIGILYMGVIYIYHNYNLLWRLIISIAFILFSSLNMLFGLIVHYQYLVIIYLLILSSAIAIFYKDTSGLSVFVILSAIIFTLATQMPAINNFKEDFFLVNYYALGCFLILVLDTLIYICYRKIRVNYKDVLKKNQYVSFDKNSLYFGIRLSIAVIASYLLIYWLKIYQGYWIVMIVLILLKNDLNLSRERIRHRGIGTLLGIIVYIFLNFIHNDYILIILLLPLVFFFFLAILGHYGVYSFFLTLIIMILYRLTVGITGVNNAMVYRGLDTLLAIVIVWISIYLFVYLSKYCSIYFKNE